MAMIRNRATVATMAALVLSAMPLFASPAAAAVTTATLISSVGNNLDGFGTSIATDGNIMVVGAPHHDAGSDVNSDEGAVFVYERGPSGWASGTEIAMLTASDATPSDQLGWAVAISGDVIAASAIKANGDGGVYVFVKPAGGWTSMTETSYLRSSLGDTQGLGYGLAMSGDMIVAGAPSYDASATKTDAGEALMFVKPAGGWTPRASGDITESMILWPTTLTMGAEFGNAIAASNSTIVVGSRGEATGTGAAYVFQADPLIGWSSITLLARLSASDGGHYDGLGSSVAIKGRFVALGAPCHDAIANSLCVGLVGAYSVGAVYVYREPFTGWVSTSQQAELQASSPVNGEMLGTSVAINDDGVYSGAPGYDHVYRFVQPSGGWSDTTEKSVEFQLKAHFGQALAGAGHTLAIGSNAGARGEVTVELSDDAPPVTTITVTPDAGGGPNGEYLSPPTLSVTASDGLGTGVAEVRCALDPASVPQTFYDLPSGCPYADPGLEVSADGSHTLYAASIDGVGNVGDVVSATVEVGAAPAVPPVTSIDLTPAAPDGLNGWYVGAVDVTVSASDADGTVAQTRCAVDAASVPASFADLPDAACSVGSIGSDGSHTIDAASVDNDGNVEDPLVSASFKIDATKPALSPSLSTTSISLNQSGVTASANATDATSGLASSSCDAVDTSTPGLHTVQCTAMDNAGNTASASIDYVVGYGVSSFFSPVSGSKWQAGQTVPIKVAIVDVNGARISDADAIALAQACRVMFSATGVQRLSAQCMKYDPLTHQFLFTWKLGKSPVGADTIVVTVNYPGTTTTTTLSESITISRK
jgi:hypothetical protein